MNKYATLENVNSFNPPYCATIIPQAFHTLTTTIVNREHIAENKFYYSWGKIVPSSLKIFVRIFNESYEKSIAARNAC